jgi:hypothetical protein
MDTSEQCRSLFKWNTRSILIDKSYSEKEILLQSLMFINTDGKPLSMTTHHQLHRREDKFSSHHLTNHHLTLGVTTHHLHHYPEDAFRRVNHNDLVHEGMATEEPRLESQPNFGSKKAATGDPVTNGDIHTIIYATPCHKTHLRSPRAASHFNRAISHNG